MNATGTVAGKGARAVDKTLSSHSAIYRETKKGVRTAKEVVSNTKSGIAKKFEPITNAVKRFKAKYIQPIGRKKRAALDGAAKIIKPLGTAIKAALGGLFIVLIVIIVLAFSSGGGGAGGGAVSTLFLDSDEDLQDFQVEFDKCEGQFEQSINNIVNGYAQTLDLQGKKMKYGVAAEAGRHPGIYYSYYDFSGNPTSVSSNIEDIMSCMAVVMQQTMSQYHTEALALMDAYYHSSHQFNYSESSMYACENGDKVTSADGTVLKNDDGTDKTVIKFNCVDVFKDDTDGLQCKPYFRLIDEPNSSIFSNKFNNFNRNYDELTKIVDEKTGIDPVLDTKGCQKLPVPDNMQSQYQSVGTNTTKHVSYTYENKNGDDRDASVEIGYPENNPSIQKNKDNRSYHNGGEGTLLLWNPIDYGNSTRYEDVSYNSGAAHHYSIESTELSDITGWALKDYHYTKDGDTEIKVITMDADGSRWFTKLRQDLSDNAKLDEDYSDAPFDISSLPSWMTDGSCVDKDGNSMIGSYAYRGFGETESKSGVTKYSSGLMGYVFYCKGHDHYECPGHSANICYGHVDLNMNIRIATMDELFNLGGVPVVED